MRQWNQLSQLTEIDHIKAHEGYSIIFKHSTRCSISSMAKRSFEFDWETLPADVDTYFLDLISHRDISAYIAELFKVHHESPQVLLIKNGECILDASHSDISVEEILAEINK